MIKKHVFKLLLFCLFLVPFKVEAYSYCPTDSMIRYQKLATNITTTYSYVEQNNSITFTGNILNVHQDLFVVNNTTEEIYYPNSDITNFTLSNLSEGVSYSFTVYTALGGCEDRALYTFYISLPYYNQYYTHSECVGYEEHSYCQRWAKANITEEQFLKELSSYKESLIKDDIDDETTDDNGGFDIFAFIAEYSTYIIVVATIILILLEVMYYSRLKKDDFKF